MTEGTKDEFLIARVPASLKVQIQKVAKETGVSVSEMARRIIDKYFKNN